MQKLLNLIGKVKNINVHYWINDITETSGIKDVIIKYNKAQLQEGRLSDESVLPHYSETSQKIYGKADIPIQLFDTGEFYNSFDLTYRPEEIYFVADPIKINEVGVQTNLFARYSVNVMGLTEEHLTEYRELLRKELAKKLKEYLNVK